MILVTALVLGVACSQHFLSRNSYPEFIPELLECCFVALVALVATLLRRAKAPVAAIPALANCTCQLTSSDSCGITADRIIRCELLFGVSISIACTSACEACCGTVY
jgi:hypothetical protein